jgi:hypothetical protein
LRCQRRHIRRQHRPHQGSKVSSSATRLRITTKYQEIHAKDSLDARLAHRAHGTQPSSWVADSPHQQSSTSKDLSSLQEPPGRHTSRKKKTTHKKKKKKTLLLDPSSIARALRTTATEGGPHTTQANACGQGDPGKRKQRSQRLRSRHKAAHGLAGPHPRWTAKGIPEAKNEKSVQPSVAPLSFRLHSSPTGHCWGAVGEPALKVRLSP